MQQMKMALIHSDIAEALEIIQFSATNDESAEMVALAREIYRQHFAGQQPVSKFALFVGSLLTILAMNLKEAKEDYADTTTDSAAPN